MAINPLNTIQVIFHYNISTYLLKAHLLLFIRDSGEEVNLTQI